MNLQASTKKTVAVLLPAKNEATTIRETIVRFHQVLPEAKIVVVDNASNDGTGEVAQHAINDLACDGMVLSVLQVGKGNALKQALNDIRAHAYLICDADLTYPIECAPKLLTEIFESGYDMAVGERLSLGHYRQHNKRRFHYAGNQLITRLVNFLFKQKYVDVASGFRALNGSFVKNYEVRASGFEFEIDISMHAAITAATIIEIPITYIDRPEGSESKLNTFRDGYRHIETILSRFIGHTFKKIWQ